MSTRPAQGRWTTQRRVAANAATVGALISATKFAGAVKVAVTARFFGAGDDLDAYLIAFVLLAFFADMVASAFVPAVVPVLMRTRSQGGDEAARTFAREAHGLVLAAMLVITVALALSARWLLPLLASGFSPAKLDLTASLVWVMLLWLPLGASMAAWRAILNAHEIFALPAAASVPGPLIAISLLYFGAARWGVTVLAAATLLGVAVEATVLAAGVARRAYPVLPAFPGFSGWRPELTGVRRQYLPLVAGAIIASGCGLVDQAVAGSMGSGSVSVLAYGTKLAGVLVAIGATAVATTLLPEFSRLVNEGAWPRLRRGLRFSAAAIGLLAIPAVALLVVTSETTVRLFLERGAFNDADTAPVASVQGWALLRVPFAMLVAVAIRMANALSANTLIVRAGAAAFVVNLILDLWLSRSMGVAGIALAGVASQLVLLLGLGLLLHLREPRLFRAPAPESA